MEKVLIKSALYGFIVGLVFSLFFVSDIAGVTFFGYGNTSIEHLSIFKYILRILKVSIIFALIFLFIAFLRKLLKKK